ncbi:MAG: hypothetical protein DWP94_00985 [Flavobacterium sp.]|nr:MAG: hypothetical protein DWP94_00985 [Flavobacterium sp.]
MNNSENISQERIERIELYLEGKMSEDERSRFESELNTDPQLAAQLDELRILILGVETAALKDKMEDFHADLSPVKTITSSGGKGSTALWRWSVAAILIVALGVFWMLKSDNHYEQLYAKHFSPDPGLPTTMSATANYEFYEGMVNYKQGDYKTALVKWESIEENTMGMDTLQYFRGVAYLADGDTENSIKYLQPLWNTEDNSFSNETAHYLGLAYLKNGDIEEAINYLTFSNEESAKEILSEIKD